MKKIASLFSAVILTFFAFNHTAYAAGIIQDWGDCVHEDVATLKCGEVVIHNLIVLSSGVVILILFIMFTIGAFSYLTSGGNPEKVKKARGTFTFAIIGMTLFLSSFLILKTIDVLFLGGCGKIFKFQIDADPENLPC